MVGQLSKHEKQNTINLEIIPQSTKHSELHITCKQQS